MNRIAVATQLCLWCGVIGCGISHPEHSIAIDLSRHFHIVCCTPMLIVATEIHSEDALGQCHDDASYHSMFETMLMHLPPRGSHFLQSVYLAGSSSRG